VSGRRPPSLERRLICRLSSVYILAFLITAMVYLAMSWFSHDVEVSDQLGGLANRLGTTVVRGADGSLRMQLSAELRQRLAEIPELQVALISVADGGVVVGSTPGLVTEITGGRGEWDDTDFKWELGGKPLVGVITAVASPVGLLRVALVRGQPGLADSLAWARGELMCDVLPVLIPVMLLTLLVSTLTIRSVMAPIRRLAANLAAIGPRATGVHLAEEGVPIEVLPMVASVNRAFVTIEAAVQQQRRLMANAAHELRTPLAVLRARIEGLDHVQDKPALVRDVVRMTRLVEQLMAVAHLDAGQVVVDGRVNMVDIACEVLADCAPWAMARGRAVELIAPDRPVVVPGNAMALGDALMNLVDNALRFTDEGGVVEVVVAVAPPRRNGAAPGAAPGAVLDVQDRGPGVAPDDRAQLFEPFWRGRDPRGSGSGLGLAIVAETVAVHGGSISYREREGGGAVFRIELPGGSGAG
jgi:signal transduction histidine kinase